MTKSKIELPVVITPTRAELGARCHRRHFLSDVLCRARYNSAALEFGSVVHAGAAAFWLSSLGRGTVTPEEAIEREWDKRFEQTDVSQESVSLRMALAMMDYYAKNASLAGPYQEAADDWQLVDVEQRYEIGLKEFRLSFQMDRAVYSKEQNWLVIGDTKTASRLDYRWDRQWETSLQMKLYAGGSKQIFRTEGRVSVFVEGVLKKVPSELRYYACPDWSDSLLSEAAFNAYVIAQMDQDIILRGSDKIRNIMDPEAVKLVPNLQRLEELAVRTTPVNYNDCFSYGIECPFRRICAAEPDERAPILRAEYFEKVDEEY